MRRAKWTNWRLGAGRWPGGRSVLLVLAVLASGLATAQETGFIEVRGSGLEGSEVFLDGTSQGVIASGALLISTVYPGRYTVRVQGPGIFPTEFEVDVAPGQVTGVDLEAVTPEPTVTTEPREVDATLNATTATFTLQCFPMACSLEVLEGPNALVARRTTEFAKAFGDAVLIVDDLPTGTYRMQVASDGRGTVEVSTGICHGETIAILADFTRDPIDLSFTASAFPNCPPVPVQTDAASDADQ